MSKVTPSRSASRKLLPCVYCGHPTMRKCRSCGAPRCGPCGRLGPPCSACRREPEERRLTVSFQVEVQADTTAPVAIAAAQEWAAEALDAALDRTTLGQLARVGRALRGLLDEFASALGIKRTLDWIARTLGRLR